MTTTPEKPIDASYWSGRYQRACVVARDTIGVSLQELRELVNLTRDMDGDSRVSVEVRGVTYNHPEERDITRLHVRKEKTDG